MLVFLTGQGREIGLEVIDPEAVAGPVGFRRVGQDHGRGNLATLVRGVGQDRLGHGAKVGGASAGLGGADGLPQTGKSKGSQQSQPRQNHQQLHQGEASGICGLGQAPTALFWESLHPRSGIPMRGL